MSSKPPADQLITEDLLTIQELANKLKWSPRSISRRVKVGEIPARLVGTQLRFVYSEVVASLPRVPAAASGRASEPGVATLDLVKRLKLKSQHYYRNQPGGAA